MKNEIEPTKQPLPVAPVSGCQKTSGNFTKGRWYLQKFTDVYTNIIRCDNGKGMDTIYIANLHGQGCNNRDNAQLISAAPDLLKALQDMLSRFEHSEKGMVKADFVKNNARVAIEKAIGARDDKGIFCNENI